MSIIATSERTLPHNLDAERSVLGAVLVHNDAYESAAPVIAASDFYRDAHRRIWIAIVDLIARKTTVDFITLKEELARVGDLDDVGGPAYISSLSDGVPRATNVVHYAAIVREKALLRDVIYASNKILSTAYEAEESPVEILKRADMAFLALQQRRRGGRMVAVKDAIPALFERLDYRIAHQGELTGIETGFPLVNELTMGWQRKDLIIIAARPSIGKTVFASNTAVAAARAGYKGVFFSYETRREQLEDRILSSLSGVPESRLKNGHIGGKEYAHISEALQVLASLPLWIDDANGQTAQDLRNACRRMQNEHGLDFVVIDYVQRMPGNIDRRGATRNDEITDISRRLKDLAGELDVPVILLSQLKRLDPRREEKRPLLDDLRESGALEQDADDVCFLHRRNHKESGTTNFIREKGRNGPTGTVNLTIDRETLTFTNGGEDPPEPAEKPKQGKKAKKQPPLPDSN